MHSKKSQLREAVRGAPAAVFKIRPATWVYVGFYLAACAVLCVLMTAALVAADGKAFDWGMDWLFPESWHFALEGLGQLFLHSASQQLLVSLALALSVMLVTVTLFPLKEHLSHSFEQESELTDDDVDPLPLRLEAWEESKLLLLYAAFFMSVFWVGYSPDPWRKNLAVVLSTLFLAITFAVDFISPTLFRHGMRYTTVFKTLLRFPVASLSFGFVFALPPILAGAAMAYFSPEHWVWILGVLFFAEIFAIVWACVGGTWLAAKMWPEAKSISRPFWGYQALYWLGLSAVLIANISAFAALGSSFYSKTPLFKSQYSLVADSLELDGVGLMDVLSAEPSVGFAVDVRISNPTHTDLVLEENRLELRHQEILVATTSLAPIRVPGGEERVQNLGVDLDLDLGVVGRGRTLFDLDHWSLTLFVELREGMEFPIYIH